jgi:phospholipid-translocating ATPase
MKIYNELLNDAMNDISERREERLAQVYDAIETQMELVGATAVEDRLQDKVPETLEALRMAGIKVWVLTGDKRETAINISKSCKHFSPDMEMLQLFELNDINQILNLLRMHWRR